MNARFRRAAAWAPFLALFAFSTTAASAASVAVRYTLAAAPLRQIDAATVWTFELHGDPDCASLIDGANVAVGDVQRFARVSAYTPLGAAKRPRAIELQHTLAGASAAGARYLKVSGPGVSPLPVGAGCQAQVAGGSDLAVKRTTFATKGVPPLGQPSTVLASLTFTSPFSGLAVLRARGYCNTQSSPGLDNGINIAIGSSIADAFQGVQLPGWGVLRAVAGPADTHQLGWSAERTLAVTAGEPATVSLFGRHEVGSGTADCTGSFTAEVISDVLP